MPWLIHSYRIHACLRFLLADFFGWPAIKTNEKTQILSSKHVSGGENYCSAGSFTETCLELSFLVFSLDLIAGQPKNFASKKTQTSMNSVGVN
jgi:hypothetical protein